MEKGTVKFFNYQKGYGFIKVESTGKDVFVHSTGLKDEINDNDIVEFEIESGQKGLSAVNVRLA